MAAYRIILALVVSFWFPMILNNCVLGDLFGHLDKPFCFVIGQRNVIVRYLIDIYHTIMIKAFNSNSLMCPLCLVDAYTTFFVIVSTLFS